MHDANAPYFLFKSQKNTWILTSCAVLGILLAARNIAVQAPPIVFSSMVGHVLAYAFEVLSTVFLIRWIFKSNMVSEKIFIGLWLLAWAMGWIAPHLNPSGMQIDRWATLACWVIATGVCVRIFAERKKMAKSRAAAA